MSASITIDATKLKRALDTFIGKTKLEAAKELRIQARSLCVSLGKATPPFGMNTAAKKQGETAVISDINKVYKTGGGAASEIARLNMPRGKTNSQNAEQAARAFSALMLNKPRGKGKKAKTAALRTQAQELINRLNVRPFIGTKIAPFDGGQSHDKARFGKRMRVPKNQFVSQIVSNSTALKRYYKDKIKNVGIAKSGWASCANLLGGMRGFPAWVKRHTGGGDVDDQSMKAADSLSKAFIKMTNKIPGITNVISQGTIQKSIDIQITKMIKRLAIIANYERKKAGL
jgi:hypothetical protein